MRISDWSSDVCSSDLEKCLFLVAPFNRCRVLDPPMRRHRAAGPDRTGLAGGIVANGENEIEFRGIRTSELVPAFRAIALGRQPHLRDQLERHRVNVALGEAARARSEEHTSELQSLMRLSYAVFC